jgi:predicted phosphoribosyltransferase
MVCLSAPVEFGGIARFYRDFSEVTETDVARILLAAREPERLAS